MKVMFAVVKQLLKLLKAVAKKAQKKKSEASMGFEPKISAIPVPCS